MRNKFLSKLAYQKVWEPNQQHEKRRVNITIFDWDDTLFPTSSFTPRSESHMVKLVQQYCNYFAQLDIITLGILTQAVESKAKVIIVTNADKQWIYYSSQLALPLTHNYIKAHIEVVSARPAEVNRKTDVHQHSLWKVRTFE